MGQGGFMYQAVGYVKDFCPWTLESHFQSMWTKWWTDGLI